MKSSRVPILINLPKELDSVEIFIAADIHTGSAEFDEKRWRLFEEPKLYSVILSGKKKELETRGFHL